MLGWTLHRAVKFVFVDIFHSLFSHLIFISFDLLPHCFCHVAFKKEEDVTILCNSRPVTERTRQQLPLVIVLTSLNFGLTEPSQSCFCGYLRFKDTHM